MDEHVPHDDQVQPDAEPGSPAPEQPGQQLTPVPAAGPRTTAGDARRGRGRRWLTWILLALVIAAVAVGGVTTARYFATVRSAEARVNAASALLDEAEPDLLLVDEAVQSEISSENATRAAEALAVVDSVKADARAAVAMLDEVRADLDADILPLADALSESATARAEMMEEAPTILEADRQAALAIAPADAALEEIKAAEEWITKAVAEFNKHTSAGVKASTANSDEAAKRLESARSLLETATASFPEADFTAFTTYIDAKLDLIVLSKEIDALWLAGKIEESNNKLNAYNDKDAQIVAMAKALPTSIRDPIADAYEAVTKDSRERYFAARERARVAGERVEELRGTATATD